MNMLSNEDCIKNGILVISKSKSMLPDLFKNFPNLHQTLLENTSASDVIIFCTNYVKTMPPEPRISEEYFEENDHLEWYLRYRYYDVQLADNTWVLTKLGVENTWYCIPFLELYEYSREDLLLFCPEYFVIALEDAPKLSKCN